jgi:hypothetical protein
MNINYRDEFSELIKNLNTNCTSHYCLERLIYVIENICSLTDLERILEAYKIGE